MFFDRDNDQLGKILCWGIPCTELELAFNYLAYEKVICLHFLVSYLFAIFTKKKIIKK